MELLEASRNHIFADLNRSRDRTEQLFSALLPERLYDRPIAERHRVVFYIGHLEAFDYAQICREGLEQKSKEPELDALFQAGIDPDSKNLPPTRRRIGHRSRESGNMHSKRGAQSMKRSSWRRSRPFRWR